MELNFDCSLCAVLFLISSVHSPGPEMVTDSFNRLFDEFGWRFVLSVVIVYGINQGLGEGWFYALQRYYFKDIMYMTPSVAQLMTAAARTPWNIKVNNLHIT